MKLIYFTIFLLFIFNLFELSECGGCLTSDEKSDEKKLTIEQFKEELTKLNNRQSNWNTKYGQEKILSNKASKELDSIRARRHELSEIAKNQGFIPQEVEHETKPSQPSGSGQRTYEKKIDYSKFGIDPSTYNEEEYHRQLDKAMKESQKTEEDEKQAYKALTIEETSSQDIQPAYTESQYSDPTDKKGKGAIVYEDKKGKGKKRQ
ncbi:hypothetical protein ACQ4LE_004783 [Meloidogyne hapla]|uniref:Uncharacterized protein n=1 Tax=Meloidogyne hapla TaxID=6305 RepID=A0A1I8BEW7_MELHA